MNKQTISIVHKKIQINGGKGMNLKVAVLQMRCLTKNIDKTQEKIRHLFLGFLYS